MNWLRKQLLNPNVHLAIAGLSQLAKLVPALAPLAVVLDTVTAVLIGTGIVLPEGAQGAPASAPRALHAEDYARIAQAVVEAAKGARK